MSRAETLALIEGFDRQLADALIGANPATAQRIGEIYSAVATIAIDRDEKLRALGAMEE
jgi:hypothetical protein